MASLALLNDVVLGQGVIEVQGCFAMLGLGLAFYFLLSFGLILI